MKIFLGITPRSWSWALAFSVGSWVGPVQDKPILWIVALVASAIFGTMIEMYERCPLTRK